MGRWLACRIEETVDVLSPWQYIDAVKTWMLPRDWAFARGSWLETETWFADGGDIVMGGQNFEASMLNIR